ncbi:MAG: phytoene/squalene synthase family protein [Chthoniobacterales bacterium]
MNTKEHYENHLADYYSWMFGDFNAKINEGQRLDLTRSSLQTADELDRYTYLVAGCVGEFWTSVCFRHLAKFADLPREKMNSLGVEYGKGLQLINILRDVGADLRSGRCYLPNEELNTVGLSSENILAEPERALPLVNKWRERAEQGIASGIKYSRAIKSKRVRIATVLPALIGERTLALLREAGAEIFAKKLKISRAEVRKTMLQALTDYSLG